MDALFQCPTRLLRSRQGRISSAETLKELTSKQQADTCNALEQSVEDSVQALAQAQDTMQEDGQDAIMELVGCHEWPAGVGAMQGTNQTFFLHLQV